MVAAITHQTAGVIAELRDLTAEANECSWASARRDEILAALADVQELRNQVDALAGQIAVAAETSGAVHIGRARTAGIWTGCEFIDGTPLHPRLAQALLGVAEFRRMILTAKSKALDVSVNSRSFPQWMRDAALVTTRGRCSEHGCDAHFHWLHMDHRKPVAKGGETNFHNGDPLCSAGNRAKGDRWIELAITQTRGDP